MHINKQLISCMFNINCLDYFSKREFERSVNIKAFLNCDTDERFFTSSGSMFQQAIRLTKNCFLTLLIYTGGQTLVTSTAAIRV